MPDHYTRPDVAAFLAYLNNVPGSVLVFFHGTGFVIGEAQADSVMTQTAEAA